MSCEKPLSGNAATLKIRGARRRQQREQGRKGAVNSMGKERNDRRMPRPNAVRVAYGISSYDSNAMKSSNPHSGFYLAETTRTLDENGGNPACNQGGC